MPKGLNEGGSVNPGINREIREENHEEDLITGQAKKMTKLEIRSVEDISKAIDEILRIIENHRNNLPKGERKRVANLLERVSKDEDIFKKNVRRLQHLFQRLGKVDAQHFQELKDRLGKTSGKEKKLIKAEIEGEEEKLRIEKSIFEFERKLTQALNSFNQFVKATIEHIRSSPYPYDAIHPLAEAKKVLSSIVAMIKETGQLEERLEDLVKTEKKLLKRERLTA
jgi:hypothetical protein